MHCDAGPRLEDTAGQRMETASGLTDMLLDETFHATDVFIRCLIHIDITAAA